MKCSELQFDLALYADRSVAARANSSIVEHLERCPLCRQRYAEFRAIGVRLGQLRRAEIPTALRDSIKRSVRSQRRFESRSFPGLTPDFRDWLQMSVMPYGVGVFASVLFGLTFLTMMFSGMLKTAPLIATRDEDSSIMLAAGNTNPFVQRDTAEISPSEYAQTRLGFANESPSINPQGALITLTKSLVRGGMKDDEVVVVADVFGNGLARIAEVVEPSRDRRAIAELQKALESDPAFAAFIPSNIETRPDSVRVVLKFQNVNVRINQRPRKH